MFASANLQASTPFSCDSIIHNFFSLPTSLLAPDVSPEGPTHDHLLRKSVKQTHRQTRCRTNFVFGFFTGLSVVCIVTSRDCQ